MSSPRVFWVALEDSCALDVRVRALSRLLEESALLAPVQKKARVAIKLHFGEEGNTGFVHPSIVREICARVRAQGAEPVLTDTNTLYRGRRTNAAEHTALAYEHGFTMEGAGAPVVIADGEKGEGECVVEVNGELVKSAMIGELFTRVDWIIGVAHFKGHIMTGFGGALKNIGMGCASRKGKLAQHSDVSPCIITHNCVGCGQCVSVCPVHAITCKGIAVIDNHACIGCASCIAACAHHAIDVRWESGAGTIQEKMTEYANAALIGFAGRRVFINVAAKITKECDCLAKDDPKIAPDIGIFASVDPVALDQATYDAVVRACGRDVFRIAHPEREGTRQLAHAQRIGLGVRAYELQQIMV